MAITLKRPDEIEKMRQAGRLVAEAYDLLAPAVKPGVTLRELDRIAEDYLVSRGAQGLYKGYKGSHGKNPPFPGVICASVNSEICHGLPNERVLRDGDIVGIDMGLQYQGYCGDACVTFAVGNVSAEADRLLKAAKECLRRGIEAAQVGNRLGDIGAAIQEYAESMGYSVVREWSGHGIGRILHEPLSVPHVGPGRQGEKIRPGMTFTIEPMINAGEAEWKLLNDGWTVVTADRKLSAQFEHTIATTAQGPEILTRK